jgi:hypothetical protein
MLRRRARQALISRSLVRFPSKKGRSVMTLGSPRVRFVILACALTVLAALQPLAAQTPAPDPTKPQLLQLVIVNVRPGMMKSYIDYQKSDVIAALQKGGVKWRNSWRTAVFGDPFQIAHVTPVASLDDYDGPPPLQKALGEAGYAAYQEKAASLITGVKYYLIRTRPDLSYEADMSAPMPKMAILTAVDVAEDKIGDFESFIKSDWIPALKSGGGKMYDVSQVVYGGPATRYYTLVGVENFAELGKGHPVIRAVGEDGLGKMMTKVGAAIHNVERYVIKLDPDLTFKVKTTSEMK